MRCPECTVDFGTQETITALEGLLLCNECAIEKFGAQHFGEEVVPSDIAITSEQSGYQCKACKKNYLSTQWNKVTLALCSNRQEKRKYVPIEKNAYDKWYLCPGCHKSYARKNIKEVR